MRRLPFLLVFLAAIGLSTPSFAARLPVMVSILPQKYFAERIGGDFVDVSVMVRPGASPVTYEPKPRQMAELSRSKIYFAIGVPFELAWLERIQNANPRMKLVHSEAGIRKVPIEAHHEHDGHGHGEILDPHVWLSPPLARIVCANIRDALCEADPTNAESYTANFQRLAHDIDGLHADLSRLFREAGEKDCAFMVFHPSWGYFARTYGLRQIPIESGGKEPSPRELAGLIREAREEGIRVIFTAPQFSSRSAETIAQSIGGRVAVADPLAYDWLANMQAVARAFSDALKEWEHKDRK